MSTTHQSDGNQSDEKLKSSGMESIWSEWLTSTTTFWQNALSANPFWTGSRGSAKSPAGDGDGRETQNRFRETTDGILKGWQSLFSALTDPAMAQTFFKGPETVPDIAMQMARMGWEGFNQLQQQWLKKAGSIGQSTAAFKFENLDEDVFKVWSELYAKEIRPFFKMPQLGLTRHYQEHFNTALDEFNRFHSTGAQFLHLLSLPVEKSFKVMQERMQTLMEEGNLPDNAKDLYQMWIKILEGHYMVLFKSAEYNTLLGRTLDAMNDFSQARRKLLEDALSTLPVALQKDMDEMSKEIYLLKKRIKVLEKENRKLKSSRS